METNRFLALTPRLAPGLTRRRLGGLLALGAAVTLAPGTDAGAHKKHRKHRQHKKSHGCPASCPVCQACVAGRTCTPVADETPCQGTGLCGNGACHAAPTCVSSTQTGCGDNNPCCNGACTVIGPPFGSVCLGQGGSGAICSLDGDCISGNCVAYRCV